MHQLCDTCTTLMRISYIIADSHQRRARITLVLTVFIQIYESHTGILSGVLAILTDRSKYRRDREIFGTGRFWHKKRIGILTDGILSGAHCGEVVASIRFAY